MHCCENFRSTSFRIGTLHNILNRTSACQARQLVRENKEKKRRRRDVPKETGLHFQWLSTAWWLLLSLLPVCACANRRQVKDVCSTSSRRLSLSVHLSSMLKHQQVFVVDHCRRLTRAFQHQSRNISPTVAAAVPRGLLLPQICSAVRPKKLRLSVYFAASRYDRRTSLGVRAFATGWLSSFLTAHQHSKGHIVPRK